MLLLFECLVPPSIAFVKMHCKQLAIGFVDSAVVGSLINIYESLLDDFYQARPEAEAADWLSSRKQVQ